MRSGSRGMNLDQTEWTEEQVKLRLQEIRRVHSEHATKWQLSMFVQGLGKTEVSTWSLWSDFLVYHIHMTHAQAIGAFYASCPGGSWDTPSSKDGCRTLIPHPRCGRIEMIWRGGRWMTHDAEARWRLTYFMTHELFRANSAMGFGKKYA